MFLCAAYALALGCEKKMVINGVLKGSPKDKTIEEYVNRFALCRCLIDDDVADVVSVTLYEDEDE